MKILTDSRISEMKNEILTKMYDALVDYHDLMMCERFPNDDAIPSHSHDKVLDIVLKNFYKKPTGEKKYDWSKSGDLTNLLT